MATWALIVDGVSHALSGGSPYWVESVVGVGAAGVRRLAQRGPMQHGVSDVGFRLEPRELGMVLVFDAGSAALADGQRDELWALLRPTDVAMQLRCVRDDGSIRQIDVFVTGMVDAPARAGERENGIQRVGVRFWAPNPIWYEPTQRHVRFETSSAGLAVPMAVPMVAAAFVEMNMVTALAYAGSFDEYPVITLTGPMTDAVLTNETSGDALDFTGTTIDAGASYVLDLRYGYKTVTEDDGTNRLGALTNDSDLATWRLLAAPDAPGGVNSVRFACDDATGATSVTMSYYRRYMGA